MSTGSRSGMLLSLAMLLLASALASADEAESFGRFGELVLYRESSPPSHIFLFTSGDGRWNQGVLEMAKSLASLDALVAGIDIRTNLAALRESDDNCLYPAADFEALSQYLQKKLDFPSHRIPVLVGYSSGATLVYATLAQAPPNTFRGGISLGFCPELGVAKPFCKGRGLTSKPNAKGMGIGFDPIGGIASPWIAFQGTVDHVCDANATHQYVSRIAGAAIVLLPKVGHGFSVQKNWMPQLRDAFRRLVPGSASAARQSGGVASETPARAPAPDLPRVADLPVVEVPATAGHSDALAFIASGDGGWARLDKDVAGVLAASGIPVVGLNTLQYYWQPRSPEESARALERILRHYLATWERQRVLLIGYSRGADVLPFMASRLPADLANRVDFIALLGPGPAITFQFHFTDWITNVPRGKTHPVQPEIEKLRGKKLLCVYGADEADSICPRLPDGLAHLYKRPGGHHFGGDYRAIAERILTESGY